LRGILRGSRRGLDDQTGFADRRRARSRWTRSRRGSRCRIRRGIRSGI
jgi:hypothetical protein